MIMRDEDSHSRAMERRSKNLIFLKNKGCFTKIIKNPMRKKNKNLRFF